MGKHSEIFRCTDCGWQTGKWVGRCGGCQAWSTVLAIASGSPGGRRPSSRAFPRSPALPIDQVSVTAARHNPSGVAELDRVLGGGLVPGAVVLLAGEPGVGKSTLLIEVAAATARQGAKVLYVTGEESAAQVRLRAERVRAVVPNLYLAAENDLAAIVEHVDTVAPALLVVDSVQTVTSVEAEGSAGGVAQVREVAGAITRLAKERGMSALLVGHVTKDGAIAGPRMLEHLVDVVLHFEGERGSRLRMVRGVKNRYGPADEVACFEMADDGIFGLPDPSGLFLSRAPVAVSGQCVTVTVEGRRALVVEVQALVAPSPAPAPRRATAGLDPARIALTLAVLERRARVRLHDKDVYTSTVGGVRLSDPCADLAVALAVASAAGDQPLPVDMVALGEIGLAGELRPASGITVRLAEAVRLGFRRALVPPGCASNAPDGMTVLEVGTLAAAWSAAAAGTAAITPARRGGRLSVIQ
jgi:DNA repair protein RadA/Sms